MALLYKIRPHTSLQTAPYIQHKLLFGILSQWQHKGRDSAWSSTIPPYANTVGRLTHLAFFEQEQLGWEQALLGQLSKKWGKAQGCYYAKRLESTPLNGDAWMTKVIHALWDYSKAICMERNDAYHGADDQETQLKRSDDLNDLICTMPILGTCKCMRTIIVLTISCEISLK
jgi:hypothetical protein